jgi:hypothetical protein
MNITELDDLEKTTGLSCEELETLRQREYDPDTLEVLGKGKTRVAYKVRYSQGDVKKEGIPIKEN